MALVQNLSLLALLCACVWLYYKKYPTQHTNTVHVLPPVYPPRTNTNHRRRRSKKTPAKPKTSKKTPAKPKTSKKSPAKPKKTPAKKKETPAKPIPAKKKETPVKPKPILPAKTKETPKPKPKTPSVADRLAKIEKNIQKEIKEGKISRAT